MRINLTCSLLLSLSCALPVAEKEVLAQVSSESNDGGSAGAGADAGADAGCVTSSEINDYQVKFVFLVESRGSLCVIDPPGEQEGGGFCASYAMGSPGVTQPGRVKALQRFWAQHAAESNVWGSVNWWNRGARGFSFQPVSSGFPLATASDLTSLGTTGDLEGGLRQVMERIEADLKSTSSVLRAKTRYQVVVLSTGNPYPICSANDTASVYATPDMPEGQWPDSPGSGDFCNVAQSSCDPVTGTDSQGGICLPGFIAGTDRNQPAALQKLASDIVGLKSTYGAASIALHTRLLFDRTRIDACGPFCQDILGMPPASALAFGTFILQSLATAGAGTFVNPGAPQQLDLSDLDASPSRPRCAK